MLIELLTKRYPGMRQWLAQRLSAVFMCVYLLLFCGLLAMQQPSTQPAWQSFFQPIWWRLLSVAFFFALSMHAWLGVRNVLKDYVFNVNLRNMMQLAVDLALIGYVIWFVMILWW